MRVSRSSSSHRGHSTYRRFTGYDYSLGGSMFITFGLKNRKRLFGKNDHGRIVYSEAGEVALRTLKEVSETFADKFLLRRYVVMPDHVHLRLTWRAGVIDSSREIGEFIGRFKQLVQYRVAGRGPSIFEPGFHDIVCMSGKMNRCVDAYIANNPEKAWLMHGDRSLLHVVEPFCMPMCCRDEIWRAVGNAALLESGNLVHLRLSRSLAGAALDEAVDSAVADAVRSGCTYVSTFYSPGERRVFEELAKMSAPRMVRLVPTFVGAGYRPQGSETPLFAAGRLLVLSRMRDPEAPPQRTELLELNEIAALISYASPP